MVDRAAKIRALNDLYRTKGIGVGRTMMTANLASLGHCDPSVQEGAYVEHDAIIGTEANHGKVWSGNVEITLAMQKAGDKRAAHRHYQMRPVMPVFKTAAGRWYLTSYAGGYYRSHEGFYYQYFNPYNGFNGCTNPLAPVFTRDLTIGSTGYDVFVLQRILIRKGFLAPDLATGGFYSRTAFAVALYQKSMGITPTSYFGPKTRTYALRELGPSRI
jgi:hypothetical protein